MWYHRSTTPNLEIANPGQLNNFTNPGQLNNYANPGQLNMICYACDDKHNINLFNNEQQQLQHNSTTNNCKQLNNIGHKTCNLICPYAGTIQHNNLATIQRWPEAYNFITYQQQLITTTAQQQQSIQQRLNHRNKQQLNNKSTLAISLQLYRVNE